MEIRAVDEYNNSGHLLYAGNFTGAFVRGRTKEEALAKFPAEISQYARWRGIPPDGTECSVRVVQESASELPIDDGDTEVLFDSEKPALTPAEYTALKGLALKSAEDFLALYRSVPDKTGTSRAPRKTFYGDVPLTAEAMYRHTKEVNGYYFGEIRVPATQEGDIYACRLRGFQMLEQQPDFLQNRAYRGSGGEEWSLRKVCRRFVWHDRIHAKAMYRMAVSLCGAGQVENPFCFIV